MSMPVLAAWVLVLTEVIIIVYATHRPKGEGDRWLITLMLVNLLLSFVTGHVTLQKVTHHTLPVSFDIILSSFTVPILVVAMARFGVDAIHRSVRILKMFVFLLVALGMLCAMGLDQEGVVRSPLLNVREYPRMWPHLLLFLLAHKSIVLVHDTNAMGTPRPWLYCALVVGVAWGTGAAFDSLHQDSYSRTVAYLTVAPCIAVLLWPIILKASVLGRIERADAAFAATLDARARDFTEITDAR